MDLSLRRLQDGNKEKITRKKSRDKQTENKKEFFVTIKHDGTDPPGYCCSNISYWLGCLIFILIVISLLEHTVFVLSGTGAINRRYRQEP